MPSDDRGRHAVPTTTTVLIDMEGEVVPTLIRLLEDSDKEVQQASAEVVVVDRDRLPQEGLGFVEAPLQGNCVGLNDRGRLASLGSRTTPRRSCVRPV